MQFDINHDLLAQARAVLWKRDRLVWIVGGAGSGKTTLCRSLSDRFDVTVYDMDAHIYGAYHGRFAPQRHPVNTAWASAPDGLAWLLDMSWERFDSFNRAALVEYLDLLAQDLRALDAHTFVVIDGGICNPALLAQALPPHQILCLARTDQSSQDIWEGSAERIAMRDSLSHLPDPGATWQKFLDFDARITATILRESIESGIDVDVWQPSESAEDRAARLAAMLGIAQSPDSQADGAPA